MGINLGQTSMKAVYLGQTAVKSVFIGSNQVWGGEEPAPTIDYLCFTATTHSGGIQLKKIGSPDAVSLETSTDGTTWTDYSWNGATGDTITLANIGDKVYFRAKNENQTFSKDGNNYYKFSSSGNLKGTVSGNIQSLLKADCSRTDAPTHCFVSLFDQGSFILDASGLQLPATTLDSNCYRQMFIYCKSLTTAPTVLPATTATNPYYQMFYGCTSLTSAPEIMTTTLGSYACGQMFYNCASLATVPTLHATSLASNAMWGMFENCSSLSAVEVEFTAWDPSNATTDWLKNVAASGTFTCPAELPDIRDDSHIPVGWQVVNPAQWLCFTAEEANSTVGLKKNGFTTVISLETSTDGSTWTDYSWSGWTGATLTLANVGDKVYFRAKNENQTIGSSNAVYYKFVMTGKIAASGNIQTLLKADGSRTDAPTYCYYNMFRDCSSLTTAPALPATTLANYCYSNMFYNCSSLTSAPALPATTLASNCYEFMFFNCTSLTTAPELPATTLAERCYQSMFYNCSKLASMDVSFTVWSQTYATSEWLNHVAASGTFTCPAELPDTRGTSNIPSGWTKVDAA